MKLKIYIMTDHNFSCWSLTGRVTEVGVKDSFTHHIYPHAFSFSLCLARCFTQMTTHTRSLTRAVLSAKSPDGLSRLWKQLKCYLWEKHWQKQAWDSGHCIHRAPPHGTIQDWSAGCGQGWPRDPIATVQGFGGVITKPINCPILIYCCKSGSRVFAFSCQHVCCCSEEEGEIRMLGSEFTE